MGVRAAMVKMFKQGVRYELDEEQPEMLADTLEEKLTPEFRNAFELMGLNRARGGLRTSPCQG